MVGSQSVRPFVDPSAAECREAIELASAWMAQHYDMSTFKLIAAENAVRKGPGFAGPAVWRLTYKPRRLVPQDADAEVGAGGEILIEVNLDGEVATMLGRGE